MKILFVSAQFLPDIGGIARSVDRLAQSLADAGHRVLVATKRRDDARPPGIGALRRRHMNGIEVAEVPGSWFRAAGFGVGRIPLLEMACDFSPHIVHAYSVFSAAWPAALIARSLRVPLVVSCRGQDVTHTIVNRPDRLRQNLRVADHVIFVSGTLARWSEFLTRLRGGSVVHNSIEPTSIPEPGASPAEIRRRLGLPECGVVLGSYADFRWKKGAHYLVDLLEGLERLGQGPDAFLLLGSFDPDLERQLADVVGRDRLVTVPRPVREEIGEFFSAVDLLLLTSYREGLPNVLLEALSQGVAVASTAVDGCLEVLSQGSAGLLLDPFDPTRAAADVGELLASPVRMARLRRDAQELVRRRYTVDRERDEVLAIYSSLLAGADP